MAAACLRGNGRINAADHLICCCPHNSHFQGAQGDLETPAQREALSLLLIVQPVPKPIA